METLVEDTDDYRILEYPTNYCWVCKQCATVGSRGVTLSDSRIGYENHKRERHPVKEGK